MFKLGVVGLGLGSGHANLILSHNANWKLMAVCDVLEGRVKAFTTAHREVQGFTDFTKLLSEVELDGLVLALPHHLHAPMSIQALEASKHVLVEKPMARNAEECRQMNAAAEKSGKTLMVAQNWRYTPWVRAVKQAINDGELGPLRAVRTDWLQNAVGDTRPGNWLLDGDRAGGGPIISLMVHNLDFLRYLLGEPMSVHAFCMTGHPGFANNAENWGMAQFQFRNGVIGQIFTSYSAFSAVDSGPLWLYGEEGTIYMQNGLKISSLKRGGGAYQELEVKDDMGLPTGNPSINELLHFVECAKSGQEPLSSGFDNINTIKFIDAIYESAHIGKMVPINL